MRTTSCWNYPKIPFADLHTLRTISWESGELAHPTLHSYIHMWKEPLLSHASSSYLVTGTITATFSNGTLSNISLLHHLRASSLHHHHHPRHSWCPISLIKCLSLLILFHWMGEEGERECDRTGLTKDMPQDGALDLMGALHERERESCPGMKRWAVILFGIQQHNLSPYLQFIQSLAAAVGWWICP